MDHRRENHHHPRQQYYHHHQPRQQQLRHHHPHPHIINSPPPSPPPPPPPSSSRYFPLHPHPPPPPLPPPSFPENNPSFFPPQHHHHRPNFHPHQKPLNDFTFVNSPPRHHHLQQHHHHLDDHRDVIYRSPSRVLPPTDSPLLYDNRNHNHSHPDDVVMDRPRFHLNELPPPPPARVPPLSPVARRSPTRFVPFDGFSRQFDREDFNVDPRVRLQQHPDSTEFRMRRDRIDDDRRMEDRRIVDRLEDDFDPNLDRNLDLERHERYYPEKVLRKEYELNSSNSEYEPMSLNGEDLTRGGRRDNSNVGFEGNVNKRFGGGREVSRSPIKFRIGGGEGDDRFGNRGRKEDVQEYNNRGTPKKNLQKKSAFLRIQEVKPQHYTSNFRNRFDNSTTPSPHKGKELNSERVDNRISEERVGSPVELDVSFKSNALVAKAIMAAPSCSGVEVNVNDALSDSGTRIDSENLSKVASLKMKSVVSAKEDKDSKNRLKVSPIMKRVYNPNNEEVRGSESSPGGSSSLSGGVARKASSKGKNLVKGDKNAGFDKVSPPIIRKKRKVTSQLSRISSPMPSKTDSELVNVDSSANPPSDGSMPSDISVKQSDKALVHVGNVIGSAQNECVNTGNFDINESPTVVDQEEIVGQPVSEESALKRMRTTRILESFPDSSGSLGSGVSDGHRNTKASNPDKDVTKAVEKCGSDKHSEEVSVKSQDTAAVFENNSSVERCSELARVCMGDNVDNNDFCPGSLDTVDSVAVLRFIPNSDHVTTNMKEEVDLMCPIVDGAEPCETQVSPSLENTTIGLSLGGLYSDRKYEPELRHSENSAKLVSFSNDADKPCETKLFSSPENVTIGLSLGGLYSDNYENELGHLKDIANVGSFSNVGDHRTSYSVDDDVNIVLKNIDTVSDVRVIDDIQDQQNQGLDTTLGNHDSTLERDESPTTCILSLSVEEDTSLVNRKRKVGIEPDSLDSRVYESCHENVMSLDFPVGNAKLPVDVCSSIVSGSSCVELDVSKGNECTESCVKGMGSLNGIDDLDRIEYSSGSCKKRKVLPLKPVFCDAPGSKSSDLPASAMTLLPPADGASANYNPQIAEGFELKSTIAGEDGAGGVTESLYVEASSFTDKSKSDFLRKDSCLSMSESALPDAEQSNLPESRCNQKKIGNFMTAEANDDNEFVALESTRRMATSDGNSGLPCLSADDTGDVDQGSLSMSMESDDNRMAMTDADSGLPCLSTDCTGNVDQGPLVGNVECDDNRIKSDNGNSVLPCLLVDHVGDVNEGSLAVNMKCAGNMALNANPSSLSGCVQSCAESMHGGVTTNYDMLDTPSNVGLPRNSSLFSSTLDISNDSPAIHVISGEKPSMDDKNSNQSAATPTSISSEVNLLPEKHKSNSKPGTSVLVAVQPFTRKSVLLPSKNVKTTMSSSNSMSRLRKNVLTRSEAIPSTSQHSPVVNPSNKPYTYQAKPRTWCRTNNLAVSNVPAKKPDGGTPHRPLYGKAVKVQDTSYIRKGNSLVRNPASGASTSGSHAYGTSIDRSKPNDSYRTRNIVSSVMPEPTELPDGPVNGGRSAPMEIPKTPPLFCSGTGQDNDVVYSGGRTSSLPVEKSEGTDNEEAMKPSDSPLNSSRDTENVANRTLEDPGVFSDGDLLGSNSKRMVYIKRKSNQLIAASKSSQLSVQNMGKTAASSSDKNYYKRRKNQLIRASSDGNIQQMVALVKNNSKSLSQRAPHAYYGRRSTKRPSNKAKAPKFSLVWKLGDSKSSGKGVDALRSRKLLSHLLPWKRATYWSRKLLSSRKRGAVYVRSGRGFSLRRSKVTSLPGTSLKWSKSMEKRSKKIEEEAALAGSALDSVQQSGSSVVTSNAANSSNPGERIFRIGVFRYRMDPSRKTLQRISDEEASDFTASKTEKDARKTYVPKRLLIGSDEYVRIGNGNQLVRDPKRRTRILASEKVRWSLHTARMRLAKKRKFCQFFTRFGKCNKGEGKCPFIHDPSKIVVCTKFLNGLCADSNCKLTHKVIPERMPDCSFYLQGLCSNEKCPYRHVNVNPKASICENFLRGYCAEGNECRKKHSYICPEFEASGSCPQGSKCKLYHPKKVKAKKRKVSRDQNNAKGRYFGSDLSVVADPQSSPIIEKTVEPSNGNFAVQGELGDFISLDVGDSEELENGLASEQTFISEDDPQNSQLDDLDEMIKPLGILGAI